MDVDQLLNVGLCGFVATPVADRVLRLLHYPRGMVRTYSLTHYGRVAIAKRIAAETNDDGRVAAAAAVSEVDGYGAPVLDVDGVPLVFLAEQRRLSLLGGSPEDTFVRFVSSDTMREEWQASLAKLGDALGTGALRVVGEVEGFGDRGDR